MFVARPESPDEVRQLVKLYNSGSFGPQEKTAFGLIGFGMVMFPSVAGLEGTPFHLPAAVIAGATDLAGLVMLFSVPIRRRRRHARYCKEGHIIEIPNEVWQRYLEVCKAKGLTADAEDFSVNIPLLAAVIVPAHLKTINAPQEQVAYLHTFIDAKLGTIADGSAAPLPHRQDPQEELEALKMEFPVSEEDSGNQLPPTPNSTDSK